MPTILLSKPKNGLESDNRQIPLLDEEIINSLLHSSPPKKLIGIQSRRYLGNKFKLLGFIKRIVSEKCGDFESLCDIFAGTGIVGHGFNKSDTKIISNELLYSNYISLAAWLSPERFNEKKVCYCLNELNGLAPKKENYVSRHFGGTFFSRANAIKIGAIREKIEEFDLSFKEKAILLTSLLYAMDKVANTCGHYDAYRKKMDCVSPIQLLMPDIDVGKNKLNEIFNVDANILIKKISADVLYVDPPYNSRQYSDAYHLLENIIRWNKPTVFGKARKMSRLGLKSRYCIKGATKAFNDLITQAKCKHILVSYNNTGKSKDGRSNARISDDSIMAILKNKGKVAVFEQDYKAFTTGRSKVDGHSERIFYCKVSN